MACASGAALLALYAVLRRIVRSSLVALVLYLPLLATGFFFIDGTPTNRFSPAGNINLWPTRYIGPYLLAWLTARHVDGLAPRRRTLLFFAGGLVLVNNTEFGAPAFGATLLALVCTEPTRSWRRIAHMAASAAARPRGRARVVRAADARAQRPPAASRAADRVPAPYLVGGWALQPMPTIGLHLAIFGTFAAALATAVVRWVSGKREALLTAMLAWSGVFGLGAGVYYVGRSEHLNLIALFSPWCLALVLLTIVAMRALAARGWRRPTLPELAVLFGFGLTCASLAQIPTPWSQVARLRDVTPVPLSSAPPSERFVAARTRPGEQVAIIAPLGHRIAYDLHLKNVSPYSGLEAMPTHAQFETALAAVRDAHLRPRLPRHPRPRAGAIEVDSARASSEAGFARTPASDG